MKAVLRGSRVFGSCAALLMAWTLVLPSTAGAQPEPKGLWELIDPYSAKATAKNFDAIKKMLNRGVKPTFDDLMWATHAMSADVLELILSKADPALVRERDQGNETTLLLRALYRIEGPVTTANEMRIVKMLIQAGSDVNAFAQLETNSPLIAAVEGGQSQKPHLDIIKLLIKSGADASRRNSVGATVLMRGGAAHLEVLQTLLAAGADPYAKAKSGAMALHGVCARGLDHELRDQPDPTASKRIALLIEPGTSIDVPVMNLGTPLYNSLSKGNPDCVRALIQAGANLDSYAYPKTVWLQDPGVKEKTVRQLAKEDSKYLSPGVRRVLETVR